MAVASFNYSAWVARYPEFSAVSQPLAQEYFDEATGLLNNTDCSPVRDVTVRLRLLNMLTAHIAALNGPTAGAAPSGLVGRISGATEGSVSVQTEYQADARGAWFNQTKYGAAYWQAVKPYWQGPRYVPGRQPVFDPLWLRRRSPWQL